MKVDYIKKQTAGGKITKINLFFAIKSWSLGVESC